MAFRRKAAAIVSRPGIQFDEWMDELREQHEGAVPKDYVGRVAKNVLRKCDPKQYLLSHATIVASVDTYAPVGVRLGRQMNRGVQIDVRWPDFRIKPECQSLINNNGDAWDRSLLLSTYRTFIGAENYCFVPSTKILMADGTLRSISDISVGDEVIGGSGLPRKVVHKHVRDYDGEVKLIYVGHQKTPIICTPNHPFLRLDRTHCVSCHSKLESSKRPSSYKKRISRQLCTKCGRTTARTMEPVVPMRVPASELEKRAVLVAPIPKLINSTIKERDDIRFARLMGFYLAEGCLTSSENPSGLIFTVGTHEIDMIQQILDCIRSLEPKSRPVVSLSKASEKCTRITVYSSFLARAIKDVCGSLAHKKRISTEWINSASPEEILNLIGAYISGDADVHKTTQRIRVCSVSLPLLEQIQFLGSTVGLSGFIVEHGTSLGDVSVVKFADGSLHNIVCRHQAHVLHFDVQSSKKICEKYSTSHKFQKRRVSSGDLKFLDDKRITFINKIESDSYTGKVFNLEVEEDHSYIVDGTVQVMNCEHIQLPELSKGFIVDAIARDLGKTAYIDILVATDRKHKILISDILSGKIDSLSMGCHLPGTQVYLSDGSPINIEDVRPEMEVISQKGNHCRVDNLQIRENRWNVQTIKATGLPTITSTDNHKYYVVRKESVERVQTRISHGHKSRPRVVEKDYAFDYADAGTIRVGDFLALPISRHQVEPDVSLSEARLLGLWVGDGWKYDNTHDSTIGVGFCLDEKHPEIIADVVESLDKVAWKNRELQVAMGGSPVSQSSTSISSRRGATYLTNCSRAFRSIVDGHTSGRTSMTKVIGKSVMGWPKAHQLAFLSGLIDSDGCVSTSRGGTKSVHLSTRNLKLAHQYMQLAARCGIVPTFYKSPRSGTKMLPQTSGVDYQIKLRNSDVHQIPSLKIRKHLDGIRTSQTGRNSRWITPNYVYSEVRSIKTSEYEGFVYDLQVDKDHSYVANGVGVSNCISLFTTCTKCGNVAADDSQICPCIQYDGKGTVFTAEDGTQQKIAELIGHVSVPNSNQFIEASWVRNPAFAGAVRRNILNPDPVSIASSLTESKLVHEIRTMEPLPDGLWNRAASVRKAQGEQDPAPESQQTAPSGDDEDSQDAGQSQDSPATDSPSATAEMPIDKLVEQAQQQLMELIVKGIGEKLQPKPEDVGTVQAPIDLESGNASLVRSSDDFSRRLQEKFPNAPKLVRWAKKAHHIVHKGGLPAIQSAGYTPRDLIVLSWIEDRCNSRNFPDSLYQIAMNVGSIADYPSETSFLAACRMNAGRDLNAAEQKFLTRKGRIASVSQL